MILLTTLITAIGWITVIILLLRGLYTIANTVYKLIWASQTEARAIRWRKRARIGDDVKFKNPLGGWTYGEVTSFCGRGGGREAHLSVRSASGPYTLPAKLADLYPDVA